MAEPPVVNASPLILLARGGCFELLHSVATQILVPAAVVKEIRTIGTDDSAVQAMASSPWLREVENPEIPQAIQAWDLGAGESAVLAWAYHHRPAEAIIDDLAARRCAASFQIPVRGTLGIILLAKRRGLISEARPVLDRMSAAGMCLSPRVRDDALRLVGE